MAPRPITKKSARSVIAAPRLPPCATARCPKGRRPGKPIRGGRGARQAPSGPVWVSSAAQASRPNLAFHSA
ncbi:hypothetical protein mvi_54000 [Methylobacterium indicum]|uniref:Uncharacterized protein n=1 Tax=Methylobacterium indicum TaxID=1775910 RepID=A0A8H8WYT7_9HYPH|nr:hypothetical protein mvi_54000 [Methylobacterium indicum]